MLGIGRDANGCFHHYQWPLWRTLTVGAESMAEVQVTHPACSCFRSARGDDD